jgi:hypothetical protein
LQHIAHHLLYPEVRGGEIVKALYNAAGQSIIVKVFDQGWDSGEAQAGQP